MDNRNDNNTFRYTYSAKEQEELKRIRQKYLPPEEDPMERIRKLDRSSTRKGTVVSLIAGILGTLVLGLGMSMAMVWGETMLIPGIVVGVIGIVMLALAQPLYSCITKKERERIAPEIMRLTDELMK